MAAIDYDIQAILIPHVQRLAKICVYAWCWYLKKNRGENKKKLIFNAMNETTRPICSERKKHTSKQTKW